jgi:HD-GYP domain-containing protein (c-di-GMP phosphodiesterase class II)
MVMKESVFQSKLVNIISQFTAAITNLRLYSHAHALVSQHTARAHGELSQLLDLKGSITMFLVGDELVLNNRTLIAAGQTVERFVRIIREKGVERITFLKGVSSEEFEAFAGDLASRVTPAVRSWPFIRLGSVEIRVKSDAAPPDAPSMSEDTREVLSILNSMDERDIGRMRELYLLAEEQKQISMRGVDDAVRKLILEIRRNMNPLSLLATVKCNDEYTFTHVVNVCILTLIQAQKLGFAGKQLYDIGMASLLHDVGKNFIPEEILSKPGKLTADERAVIETHPVKGGRYLMEVGGIPKIAVLAAMEHHLRFDGTGYPLVKPGWKPNIVAQLITIADVFDALRSRRSYSEPKPMSQIVDILNKEKGTTFNPILVESFLEIVAPELTLPPSPEIGEKETVEDRTPLVIAGSHSDPCTLPR